MDPLPNIIEPRWWTGELPIACESFTVDCSAYDMSSAIMSRDSELSQRQNSVFDEVGVYNHWQQSMMTDDPDEAEGFARARGLETEWGANRLLRTRYYISAFEYYPPLDRNVLYSSIADDGHTVARVSTWMTVSNVNLAYLSVNLSTASVISTESGNAMKTKHLAVASVALIIAVACSQDTSPPVSETSDTGPTEIVNQVADDYYAHVMNTTPETAYFSGIELERHDGLADNSLEAGAANEAAIDGMLASLRAVEVDDLVGDPAWITYAYLLEELEGKVGVRVCRSELWSVNQMGGWHSGYAQIAQLQPVGTAELREQSLARWSKFSGFIDQEMENLGEGIKLGYTAPKTVVQRVIDQVDGQLALDLETSPYYSPAVRDGDQEFAAATRRVIEEQIMPALQRYRAFLAGPYLDRARDELSITANPGGRACYDASLRSYTTLKRSAEDVFELGKKTVEANKASVIELGKSAYELTDFTEILQRAKSDPADKFTTRDELLEFSREMVKRAEAQMPNWVGTMPGQPVEVVPFAEHEEGTGRSAHYRPGTDERPGEYRIPLHQPEEQSRGGAESVAFHEAWPGHHLQVAVSKEIEGLHPVTEIIWFSGPGEGWARYSEALSEEMGLYQTTTGPITRRAWPARGMVVDPGIHLFGWTREEAIDFMMVSGRFPEAMGDQMVDRIAILPGQLTAYDSGGLEIIALRKQAEEALGDSFDIREFHDRILENGTIPLPALRTHIESWLASQ